MVRGRDENLELLQVTYQALHGLDKDRLAIAYKFGQIIDALAGTRPRLYSYAELGLAIDRSASTITLYAMLYRKYPTLADLQETAARMETWDVSRLAGRNPLVPPHFFFQCGACGSTDVAKKKGDKPGGKAEGEAKAVAGVTFSG